MSLYDIIDEITERQVTKTETGDTRVPGVMLGIVAKNYHKDMGGRVCVTIPTRDANANELQWARLAMPSSGQKWGHYFLPEVGDQVLLAFEGGNIERPYIIGCVPKDNNPFLTGSVDQNNQYKRIVTKHGSTILFEDNSTSEDGLKDKITIQTAGQAHTVLLDNENKKVRIEDKAKQNFIEMTTQQDAGTMTIQTKSKLTIQVGDTIKLILNGESGMVKIEAKQVNIDASDKFGVKSDGTVRLEGSTVTEKASSMYKAEGDMISLSGSQVKIG